MPHVTFVTNAGQFPKGSARPSGSVQTALWHDAAINADGYEVAPTILPSEVEFIAIRAQGPGGQNVNKVSCAVHARFDVNASSLPAYVKERLLDMRDSRITRDGVVVLKAQQSRSLEQNKEEALQRLQALVDAAAEVQVVRRPTKPTRGSQRRRLDEKTRSGQVKALRGKVRE